MYSLKFIIDLQDSYQDIDIYQYHYLNNSVILVSFSLSFQDVSYGDESLSYEVNRSILTLTITYILKTERLD